MGSTRGKTRARLAGFAVMLAAASAMPMTVSAFAETPVARTIATVPTATLQPALLQPGAPKAAPAIDAPTAGASNPDITGSGDAAVAADAGRTAPPRDLDAELVCLAKVVHHEAGAEPRAGQLAVAQLILKRVASGRFADSVCGVANQRGQFFDIASYNPSRDTPRWASAVEVSLEAMSGKTAEVAPGALFFNSVRSTPTSFFRSRQRVATIGHQVFYR